MAKTRSITVKLPCCKEWIGKDQVPITVQVTGRFSKQMERPRNHQCKKCGTWYRVDASNGKAKTL